MELLVIRHGIAEDATEDMADADRALTRKGRRRFKQVVRGLEARGVEIDRVLFSPWKRAAETAHLLRPVIANRRRDALVATDALTASPTQALLDLAFAHSAAGVVAVVGHQPWLGELVSLLVVGDPVCHPDFVLKKGGVTWLEGDAVPGGMALHALLPPRLLRR